MQLVQWPSAHGTANAPFLTARSIPVRTMRIAGGLAEGASAAARSIRVSQERTTGCNVCSQTGFQMRHGFKRALVPMG